MRQSLIFISGFVILSFALVVLILSLPSRTESAPAADRRTQIEQGIKLAKMKVFEQAQTVFEQILAQQPENPAALNNLANVYLLTGRYGSAAQKYWEAARYDPEDTNIHLNLAIVCYLQMELIPDEVYVGDEKSTTPKADWQAISTAAFDRAFENLESAADACLILTIPKKAVPEYHWVQQQLKAAAKRVGKPDNIMLGGSPSRSSRKIPVYWKLSQTK
jgi:thioredoxin-like negative regulator of GroEL